MGKTWMAAGTTLQTLMMRFVQLGAAPDPAWIGRPAAEIGAALRAADDREGSACDRLITSMLSQTGTTDQSSPIRLFLCSTRCLCALDTMGILHAELKGRPLYSEVPQNWTDGEVLEWLLISNWKQRRETWLKLTAYSAATGGGLYSGS